NAIKSEGRIRKYNEQQVLLLRRIYDLLYNQRYTIEGARKIIKQEKNKIQTKTKETLDDSLSSPKKDSEMKTEITEILQDIKKDLTLIQQTCKNYNQDKK
ncbi:MAG: MerR family transcriptional regulator, partial [Candidatus Cloacimonetes bacterium]|nr:MerR family transcriptional regulator [Candidatus Cloacimonadota bacterium]